MRIDGTAKMEAGGLVLVRSLMKFQAEKSLEAEGGEDNQGARP